jgi:hypothetical protein
VNKVTSYKAGAASVCITPDEPLWLAGYAARTTPALGKLTDLYAGALALEDDAGQRFVIASMDLIAITRAIAEPVAEAVEARHGLSRKQLLLTATHTHYAPEFRPEKQLFFNVPAEYGAKLPAVAAKLIEALTNVIDQALARLEPVRLFARKATAGFAHNRRRRGVKFGNPSTEDSFDHDVPVLDCVDAAGQRKAIVFGYACHNTTIPLEDERYCGDWAGFAKERLQQGNPGAAALFIPGAGAEPDPEPRGSIDLSRQYGQEMADAVQQALDRPGVEITGPMRVAFEEVRLPLQAVTHGQLEQMLASDDPPQRVKAKFLCDALDRGEKLVTSCSAPIQVVRFGNELLLIALGGEPVVDWAHKLRGGARSEEREAKSETQARGVNCGSLPPAPGSPIVWVAGYCNDMCEYIPTRRVQAEGGYEGGRANLWSSIPAPFTDDVEDRVTAAVHQLVKRVGGVVE